MPVALIVIGLLLIITGVRNTYAQFGAQVRSDFTGPGNFTAWLVSIGLIGAVGYVPSLRAFSNAFLALVLIVIILKNGGVFDKLKEAVASGGTPTPANAPPTVPSGSSNSSTQSSTSQAASVVLPFAEAAAFA